MSSDEKQITVSFILEVIGRPPEHLVETLKKLISQIREEKGIKIIQDKVNEPVLMKDQKDFYTDFAEIELEIDSVLNLILLMFKYMPAHIEIIHPDEIKLKHNDLNLALNELIRRLHGYDEIARIIQAEKAILEKKLKAVLEQKGESEKQPESKPKKANSKQKNN